MALCAPGFHPGEHSKSHTTCAPGFNFFCNRPIYTSCRQAAAARLRAFTRIPCMSLFDIGVSGLNAAQWGLTVTGQNISNAATPGYTLESPVYQEASGQYTTSGYLGSGVQTATVARSYSSFLTTQLNNAQSN